MKNLIRFTGLLSLLAVLAFPMSNFAFAEDTASGAAMTCCDCCKNGTCGKGECKDCKNCKDCECCKTGDCKKDGSACKSGKCGECKNCHKSKGKK